MRQVRDTACTRASFFSRPSFSVSPALSFSLSIRLSVPSVSSCSPLLVVPLLLSSRPSRFSENSVYLTALFSLSRRLLSRLPFSPVAHLSRLSLFRGPTGYIFPRRYLFLSFLYPEPPFFLPPPLPLSLRLSVSIFLRPVCRPFFFLSVSPTTMIMSYRHVRIMIKFRSLRSRSI